MNTAQQIRELADKMQDQLTETRRYLHAHPELSYQEEQTMEYVAQQLDNAGIPFEKNIAGYGLVGYIRGHQPDSKTIALRGDMDALPIEEKNEVSYKSCNPGVMHACGHDVHTTCLLGAANILNSLRHELKGTIKLIFQPAEERLPGGASIMIKEGVLKNPDVETITGQHVLPQMEVGKVGFCPGIYMASCDELFITVRGKGGHGAQPNLTVDTVLVASHIVVALQQVVSRKANPIMPSVLTMGKFIANGATNIIPGEVYMEGTFRTFDEKWREDAKRHIRQLVEGIAASMDAEVDLRIEHGYPYLKNDVLLTEQAIEWAKEYLGAENVEELPVRMTAEDFSYYTHLVPACFYRLGTGNSAKGITSGIHTPTFDIDESALPVGAGLMAYLAYKQLS